MAATIGQVREALCAALHSLEGWSIYPYMHNAPDVPAIIVLRARSDARNAMTTRAAQWSFRILALVSMTDLEVGSRWLDGLTERGSSNSLWDALEADTSLDSVAQTLIPGGDTGEEPVVIGDVQYLSTSFLLDVVPVL